MTRARASDRSPSRSGSTSRGEGAATGRARPSARERERSKDALVAGLVHDLRNPLNIIMTWTHLLRDGSLDSETTTRALDSLRRHAEVQARLLANFVSYSSLLNGATLERTPVDLARLVGTEVAGLRRQAADKPIQLDFDAGDGAPRAALDEEWTATAVRCLLEHAIESTPPAGRVDVVLRESDSTVEIRVAQSGGGFDAEELAKLRDPVGPSDRGRGRGNLRLEVAIADRVAELHGGTLEISSAGAENGARYLLKLPS